VTLRACALAILMYRAVGYWGAWSKQHWVSRTV